MTPEQIGSWIGILLLIGIPGGGGAVFNAQPQDRSFKTFFQYFVGSIVVCILIVIIWRGVSSFF